LHKALKDTIFQRLLVWLGQAVGKERHHHLENLVVVMIRRGRVI